MKPNPAPWEYENVERPHDSDAYGVVKDANGKILFDTLNSDVAEIYTEEDEGCFNRWDEQAQVNLTLAAAAPKMLAACKSTAAALAIYRAKLLELGCEGWIDLAVDAAVSAAIAAAEEKRHGG